MDDLRAACDALASATNTVNQHAEKLRELEASLAEAVVELREAEAHMTSSLAAQLLDETGPKQVKAARERREQARDTHDGLNAAIATVRRRLAESLIAQAEAEGNAEVAARPHAVKLAERELGKARRACVEFAGALERWHQFDGVAAGGLLTGRTQQNRHQCIDLLREHGIRGIEDMQIGDPEGRGRLLSPAEILELIK